MVQVSQPCSPAAALEQEAIAQRLMSLTEAATRAAMSAEKSHNYNLHVFTVRTTAQT